MATPLTTRAHARAATRLREAHRAEYDAYVVEARTELGLTEAASGRKIARAEKLRAEAARLEAEAGA